jgi:transcription termination factor Rho
MTSNSSDSLPFGAEISDLSSGKTANGPAGKKAASKKKATKKPTAKRAAPKKAATKKAAVKKPAAPKAALKKPAAPKAADKKPVAPKAADKKPVVPKAADMEAPTQESAAGAASPAASSGAEESQTEGASKSQQDMSSGHPEERKRRRRRSRGRRRNRGKQFAEGEEAEAVVNSEAFEREAKEQVVGFGERAIEVDDEEQEPESASKRDSENRLRRREERKQATEGVGLLLQDRGGVSALRPVDDFGHPSKQDIFVPKHLVLKEKLREGMIVRAKLSRGQKHKYQVSEVIEVDGAPPKSWMKDTTFRNLTSIDPDFHYAMGDGLDDTSMRIVDLLSPVGRGQRGLLVAPPRSGKTTLLRTFARGIEDIYSDVHLFVLLVDERPEEATEWQRAVKKGQVFASTADETPKHHIQLAEAVWKRCCRLVEMGEDVVLLIDSLTRLSRAYNNQLGAGRTMSGGLDTRAMEYPRKLFGSARNTETAGSLTILGTILIDTGSKMDQLVFEEFKGTGNMELVLNRRLADRRIFPAIDIEKTGTRKEEKLLGQRRLKQVNILRRVMSRLHFAEAMEMLITRLDEVEKTDEFLSRFTTDPEA